MVSGGQSSPVSRDDNQPLLSVRNLSKSYGLVQALRDVSVDFHGGEIHALIGENGAGKTTLERLIAGEEKPDEGRVLLAGDQVDFGSPGEAQDAGISVVHQSFPLVPQLSVAENMLLGKPPRPGSGRVPGLLSRGKMRHLAERALNRFGITDKAGVRVADLSLAERQLVEIARAMMGRPRVVIFDEPTSSLSPVEAETLFKHMEAIRVDGAAVIFISHRIDEIRAVADRITVLRDGRMVHTGPAGELNAGQIVSLIAGREIRRSRRAQEAGPQEDLLVGRVPSAGETIDLKVGRGEIVGVAGLLNSGAQRLLAAISGEQADSGDQVSLQGEELRSRTVAARIAAGICLLPGDHEKSLALHLNVRENILLPNLGAFRRGRLPLVDGKRIRREVDRLISELGVRPPHQDQTVQDLSGGNKQKVAMAKWLASHARVIVMDDPFRGVDVGAKEEMGQVISRFTAAGGGVLIYSSDTRDLIEICDRVLVLRAGELVAEFSGTGIDEESIMAAATGLA